MLTFVILGAYSSNKNLLDLIFVFVFGALGYAMKAYGYNRPALFLGFVLGEMAERYYWLSLSVYGTYFFLRPISIIIIILTILALFYNKIRSMFERTKDER